MERHSCDYSRFDAIDADAPLASAYDGGFKADLTWHNSRTTSFVFIAVEDGTVEADVSVTFEAHMLRVELAKQGDAKQDVALELGHPAVLPSRCQWSVTSHTFGDDAKPCVSVILEKAVAEPWDEVSFGARVQRVGGAKRDDRARKVALSDAAIACHACGAPTKPRCRVVCVCTEAVFCCNGCSRSDVSHNCPGPVNVAGAPAGSLAWDLAAHPRAPRTPASRDYEREGGALLRRHVFDRLRAGADGGPRWRLVNDVAELRRCAAAGNAAAAFRAASLMLLTKEDPPAATALLEAAAEAGCAPAMVPLALRLLDRGGDAREAESWLWRGARLGCDVAARALDERCQLSADVRSVLAAARDGAFRAAPPPKSRDAPMRTMLADKAALGSLVLCLRKHALPTCLLEKLPGRPAALACAAAVRDFETLAENAADERRVRVIVAYGRALSAAEHDREVPREPRPVASRAYLRPVLRPGRDDGAVDDAAAAEWVAAVDSTAWDWRTTCVHERKKTSTPHCAACLRDARARLDAVASRSYALSVDAHREVHDAAYALADGAVAHEPFARYAMGEVDSVLALLAAAPEADVLLHPLFIASDPNLLWPALYFYGSLANALRAFRPDAPATVPPHRPLVCGVADGEPLILACGACGGLCRRALRCGKCKVRAYCAADCQKRDWRAHKAECCRYCDARDFAAAAATAKLEKKRAKAAKAAAPPDWGE